jgi:hypothetical protein
MKDSIYKELECVFDKFSEYHIKIMLGDFNAKASREDIFKPTIGNKSLHKICNDNAVKGVNFATSKNLSHKYYVPTSQHPYTWTPPDGKTHNQFDHILIAKQRHSSVLDV